MTKIPTPIARCRRRFLQWTRVRPGPRKPINASNWLRAQLPDRHRTRDRRGRGSHSGPHLRRGGRDQDHERAHRRDLGLKPDRLVADTAYGTGKFLGWLVGTGITPHIPVDKSDREDGTFSRSDFTFNRR